MDVVSGVQGEITNLEASASVRQGTMKQILLVSSKEDSGTASKGK